MIHLVGPFGSGKSAIVDGLLARAGGPTAKGAVVRAAFGARDHLPGGERGLLEGLIMRIAEGVRVIDAPDGEAGVPWLLPGVDFLRAVAQVAELPGGGGRRARPAQIHADLLLHVTRNHPVLLALDDVHQAAPQDQAILTALARGLAENPRLRLLVVCVGALPLGGDTPDWTVPGVPVERLAPLSVEALTERAAATLGSQDPERLHRLAEQAAGSARVLDRLASLAAERADDPTGQALVAEPQAQGLAALARGERPAMTAHVQADLRDAAVAGPTLETGLMARLWGVPPEAARERLAAVAATGMIFPLGDRWRFVSATLADGEALSLPAERRADLHRRVAHAMRAEAQDGPSPRQVLDVTETWSELRRRGHRVEAALDLLWRAAWHFAMAGAHLAAADAAILRVERLFQDQAMQPAAPRGVDREARERRHAVERDLGEAEAQLELARGAGEGGLDPALLAIEVRLLTARARSRELTGDYATARRLVETAVTLARHLPDTARPVRLEALRVQVEIAYASGDHNAGRASVADLLKALAHTSAADAVPLYGWLAEAVGRSEWVGLHDRIYPTLLEALRHHGAHREAIKARVDRLGAAVAVDEGPVAEMLLAEAVEEARVRGQQPYLAELLAQAATDLVLIQVDAHFDSLSGEFFPPDLFGDGEGPPVPPLRERLARPVDVLTRAEVLAESAGDPVAHLRVLSVLLALIYEVRERLGTLLHRWWPSHGAEEPLRLLELDDLLSRGFFDVEQLEALTQRVLVLAQTLGLDQLYADTLYEAIDRGLPGLLADRAAHIERARAAYERLDDAYGQLTLALLEARDPDGAPEPAALSRAEALLRTGASQLSAEQLAFAHLRLGELRMELEGDMEPPLAHFEAAFRLYDQVGDVQNMQTVAEFLRDVYRKQGDLGRYRVLRERFRALEDRAPGVDPLGLEFRIEHLLNLARQEPDEQKAIEMVERCVALFARVPDGTARVDECFVEISKLCRRRADDAQTEAGYQDWLHRSLEAVRTAGAINRELGNYHRLFEESHELFDDLIGLGAFEDYLRARGESRALAFELGNVGELLYLFEEHMQYDPAAGFERARLPELRGFYEALVRYLLGLGAAEPAQALQRDFVRFLDGVGEVELAEAYRGEVPLG